MAADKETREVEILLNAQQANASIKDMAAGVALMNNQLAKMTADDPRREQLKKDFQELKDRVKGARDEINGVTSAEEKQRLETERLAQELAALNQRNVDVVLNGKKLNASFQEMTDSAALLEQQLHELASDAPERKQLIADYQAMQDRIEGMKKEMGQATQESNTFRDAMAFAGVTVGAEALIEGVKELGAEIINTTKEVADLRSNINTLTGATGQDLDGLTTSVLAVSRTFGKDFNEVLQASNTLSKQMGVSQQEALRLIQQGFLAGADAGGDFLDQVKEYAPQFKNAGYAADEFIGHISQASTQGIFSDKGADVVKEFGLRIREQTKATTEAMQAAFGSDFTRKIFAGINDGSLTVEQALQRVGQQMNDTKIPANQLQTVIADVFGGPGEDAGIDYLKSLQHVGKGVDELVDKTNVYTQRQQRLLASQTELAEAQNALTKEFEGGSTVLDTLTNQSLTLLYTLLASLGATFKELFEPVQRIWASFAELAESLGWVSEGTLSAKSAGQLLGDVIHFLFTPTRLLWGVIADVVKATVEWAKSSDNARAFLQFMAAPVRDLYELLRNGPAYFAAFSAGAESSFATIGRAWQKVKDRDFSGAASEFATIGRDAGDAYQKAFSAALARKAQASAPAPAEVAVPAGPQGAQGGDGITDAAREKAAKDAQKAREKERKERKAEQDKADQERLNNLKRLVKEEGDLLVYRNTLKASIDNTGMSDEWLRQEEQRKKIFDAATKKVEALTGLEADYTEQVAAIVAERDLRLRELWEKSATDEEKRRQQAIDERIAASNADAEVRVAEEQLRLANGVITEQEYQDAIYAVKQAAMQRELDLIKLRDGEESVAWKKLNAEKIASEADHAKKVKNEKQGVSDFSKKIGKVEQFLNGENIKFLEDSLGQQTVLYKAFEATRKAISVAQKAEAIRNIGIAAIEEGQEYFRQAAKMGPIAGPIYGLTMSTLAFVRAGVAAGKIAGFAKGGATGDGVVAQPGGMWEMFKMGTGLSVGANGKLSDGSGHAVAGIVHEDEYVIPKWMRQDPQVMQVEGWLEQRRQRGYYEGGPTSEGSSLAPGADVASASTTSAESQRLVRVLESLDQRLQLVEEWPTSFEVVLDLLGLDRDLTKLKKVKDKSEIRPN